MAEVVYEGEDETRRTDRWIRFLAREEVLEDGYFGAAPHKHKISEPSWKAAVGFARELFGALYDQEDTVLEGEQGPNAAAISGWWEKVEEVESWQEQREKCAGNAFRAGMVAGSVVDYVCEIIEEEEQKRQDDSLFYQDEDKGDGTGISPAIAQAVANAMKQGEEDSAIMSEAMDVSGGESDDLEEEMSANMYGDRPGTPVAKEPSRAIVEAMRKNKQFRDVMKLVGQMRPIVRQMRSKRKVEWMRDEVAGIEMGGDVDRILSSEAMALMDDDLEFDFLRRLSERKVVQRKMKGLDDAGRGPVIFCLDESGSMAGDPDDWAKSVAIAMAEVAMQERRPFSLVHFDSRVARVDDVFEPISIAKLVEMIGFFSNGGTNFDPPIRESLSKIKSERVLRTADIVLLTDGWGYISQELIADMKRSETRLHVVAIGVEEVEESVKNAADSIAFIPSLRPENIEAMQVAFQAV